MSEAVTNAEIEDVLSSIRRLVSENAPAEGQSAGVDEAVEKLVLTPAFRVYEADPITEPVVEIVPEDRERDSAENAPVEEAQPETVFVAEAPMILETPAVSASDDPSDDPDTGEIEPPMGTDEMAAAWDAERGHADTLEDRIAELEAAVEDTAEDWEPDGSEDEAEAPQTVVFEHASWAPPEDDSPDAEVSDAEVISDASPEPTPFREMPDEPPTNDAIFDEDDSDEAVIDEEALREMVSRLVREELQGTVGERITRNVRRLVRREIQRAMTLKDFD